MLRLAPWLVRKLRRDHESLLNLLLAAKREEDTRNLVSRAFRAGYKVGQMNPRNPLDPPDYEI
jgi:hypothetical protein